jgi:hypothetical protein
VGDSAANAGVAGGGTWDNTSTNWASAPLGTPTTAWSPGGNAQFQGTVGGSVNTGANLNVGAATFDPGAGAFTLTNTFDMEINGAGLSNNSSNAQTIANNPGTMNFNLSSSASAGTAAITYSNTGFMNFNGSSTAGNASITNNGLLTFNATSSYGTSSIVNNAAMDISGLTSSGIGASNGSSLTNNGSVELGQGTGGVGKSLQVSTLTLDGGSEFDFTLGTTQSIVVADNISDLASPSNRVTIDVEAGAGFGAPEYSLIFDFGGTVNLNDYALGNVPAGYILSTADAGHDLVLLSAVPEISSFTFPLVGAAGLMVWLSRRRSQLFLMQNA